VLALQNRLDLEGLMMMMMMMMTMMTIDDDDVGADGAKMKMTTLFTVPVRVWQ
jgi:hypothetical protein